MRDHSIVQLVETWFQILNKYNQTSSQLTNLCLESLIPYIGEEQC